MFARLYTGEDGHSHFEDLDPGFKYKTEGPYIGKEGGTEHLPAAETFFETIPPGYIDELHVATRRRYHITLKGQVEVSTGAGEKRVFGPGDVMLVEDYTGTGHNVHCIGDEQRYSIVVYL